jgi:hypothetical protein
MKKLWKWLFETRNIHVVIHSSTQGADKDHSNWCKIFDDIQVSPYIDVSQVRECDIIAITSWLSSNYYSPIKRDTPNFR